ncbi:MULTISPECIES: tRNA (adenosine(37)-N6)-threonylcarbamoyltransferase complex ATPase subunit type 1 TsaE [unclassified Nonlabens]|uniref:tRNA (adenosine(37)-N6)-threonylcarbamoyltransferase complex ATPase subunit type 1 TsaE n=1 Tax=unclassified Nonlabens TaxID=2615035 RepID=UPI003868D138
MKYKLEEIDRIAREILKRSKSKVILFDAPMGAGKTTLIKSVCRELGVEGEITSPTFSIVNQHSGRENKIYHFDLYRIENTNQLFDIGFEDYLENDAFCLIEWPEISISLLSDYQKVKINILDPETREITFID